MFDLQQEDFTEKASTIRSALNAANIDSERFRIMQALTEESSTDSKEIWLTVITLNQ